MAIDFNRAGLLLHVADYSAQWPDLSPLTQAALAELREMIKPPAKTPEPTIIGYEPAPEPKAPDDLARVGAMSTIERKV